MSRIISLDQFERLGLLNKVGQLKMSCTPQQRQDWFILRSKKLHNNKYDYGRVKYKNARTNVIIVCKSHGVFEQLPTHHLKGSGCPKCANNVRLEKTEFISRSNKIHQHQYSYSKIQYVNSKTKVTITCPIHGDFEQLPTHHLRGSKCPKCAGKEHNLIYLWKLGNTSLYKLGISCTTNVRDRIRKVATAHSIEPTKISIFAADNVKELEDNVLHHFKDFKQKGQLFGEGHTEILVLDDDTYLHVMSCIKKHGAELVTSTNTL